MLRSLVPLLLLTAAFALPAASAEDPCDKIDCPRPILVVDGEKACVGVANGYGGQAACWFADRPHCVTRYFWNAYQETCLPLDNVGTPEASADPCGEFVSCPRPIVEADAEHACVGVAFQIGGYAACWYAARPNCLTQYFGYAYTETCAPPEGLIGP